jgi:hypothetical protein
MLIPIPGKKLNSKQTKTFRAIFEEPTRSDIHWEDIASLVKAFGGEEIFRKQKTGGSRARFKLNGVRGFFHKPHPERVTHKACVESVREFLMNAGVVVQGEI